MNSLPYQKHSETSRAAAQKNTTSKGYREEAFRIVTRSGADGCTGDQVDEQINVPTARIATRLKELCDAGAIICTTRKRKTRCNRDAYVYVHRDYWNESMGKAQTTNITNKQKIKLLTKRVKELEADLEFIGNCKSFWIKQNPEQLKDIARRNL